MPISLAEFPSKSGLHVLVPGKEPIIDIIAVHGLGAHPVYTWAKKVDAPDSDDARSSESEIEEREELHKEKWIYMKEMSPTRLTGHPRDVHIHSHEVPENGASEETKRRHQCATRAWFKGHLPRIHLHNHESHAHDVDEGLRKDRPLAWLKDFLPHTHSHSREPHDHHIDEGLQKHLASVPLMWLKPHVPHLHLPGQETYNHDVEEGLLRNLIEVPLTWLPSGAPGYGIDGGPLRKRGNKTSEASGLKPKDLTPVTSHEAAERKDIVWLKDLLPEAIPNARILVFNHNSTWINNPTPETIRSIGTRLAELIDELRAREQHTMDRPILFLGHSFGGVVIEEALLYSYRPSSGLDWIPRQTYGVVFLGTPLRGTNVAKWGKLAANFLTAFGFKSNNKLLEALQSDSERLSLILHDFTTMARKSAIEIVCFYELNPTPLGRNVFGGLAKMMIVDKESATIDGYESISLPLNHSQLNKYGSMDDEGFRLISDPQLWTPIKL